MIAQLARPEITFDPGPHAYRLNGHPVPSVTQVLEPLNDWSQVDPMVLAIKRADGRDVHEACNLLVREQLDWSALCNHIRPYVQAAASFLQTFGGVVIASEKRVGSLVYGVAGTLDLLIEKSGWLYFIDWKISEAVPSTVGLQLAAYELLYNCTIDPAFRHYMPRPRAKRLCVRLNDDGRYRCDAQIDWRADWNLFTSALVMWRKRESKYG